MLIVQKVQVQIKQSTMLKIKTEKERQGNAQLNSNSVASKSSEPASSTLAGSFLV